MIASRPLGWLPVSHLKLPPGGGRVPATGGIRLVAEPVGCEEAFVVRAAPIQTSRSPGPAALTLGLLGRDCAEVELSGVRLAMRLRHSEILTLLCAHPDGLSSEELSFALYGDPGRSGGVRVEMSRLRKLLGEWIEPDRYRLRPGVSSDVAEVCGLLYRGDVRQAALRYLGPLLPRSEAPGVVHQRQALEHWMRQSVMSFGDQEALWAWLSTSGGEHDLAAWQRLLSNLPFQDPRRSLAASRVGQLRNGTTANGAA